MTAVPFQANQRFGQYTLVRPIAVGGMAEVWLAKLDGPQGFQKKVALKRMTGSIAEQPQFVTMFLDEARLMSGLTHPNICQVFELGEREDNFYVAMEFIDGETVQHVMRAVTRAQQRLPMELAIKIARDCADALHYAHTKQGDDGKPLNVIHRDVSPQNLMVTYEGVPKLLDFGIAKAATRTNATEVGQLKGKLSYMPPEQARGETLDQRADQFSLGVMLFEMLTHTRLYPPLKEMDLFRKVALEETPYETARQREPSIPEDLSNLVARMMERDATKRYPSLAEVRDQLTAHLHDHTTSIPSNEAMSNFMTAYFPPETRGAVVKQDTPEPAKVHKGFTTSTMMGRSGKRWQFATIALLALLGTGSLAMALWPSPKPVEDLDAAEAPPTVKVIEPPAPLPEPEAEYVPYIAPPKPEIQPEPEPEEEPESIPKGVKAAPPKKKVAPAPKGKGLLSLQTSPWSIVRFGKKNLGETPLVGVPFPVGRHRLVLTNDERKLRTTIEVEIKAGQTTTLKLKL